MENKITVQYTSQSDPNNANWVRMAKMSGYKDRVHRKYQFIS